MIKRFFKNIFFTVPYGVYLYALLSVLLIIPSYPAIVSVGYLIMAVFTLFMIFRSNKDIEFDLTLPISRNEIVKYKLGCIVFMEVLNIVLAVPFALIANYVISPCGNIVGIDPNFTFFGISLLCYSVFNLIFLPWFFKTAYKIGLPLLVAAFGFIILYMVFEMLLFLFPSFKAIFDTLNIASIGYRIIFFIISIILYIVGIIITYIRSCKSFDGVNF